MAFELTVVARSVFLATTFVVCGTALFALYAPKVRAGVPVLPRTARVALAALALISALVWFGTFVAASRHEGEGPFETASAILFETGFGPVWLIRLAALAILVLAAFTRRELPLLVLSSVVIGCEGWTGHAVAWGWLGSLNQALHALAGAAWIGALVALALEVRHASRDAEHLSHANASLSSFSGTGVLLVVVIAGTGAVNTWMALPGLPDLSRVYDMVLLVKVGLFGAMLAIAAINRFILVPAMLAANRLQALMVAISLEQTLGALILIDVSALGLLSPTS